VTAAPLPQAIHRADDAITITWAPGHVGVYPARALRLACPCAMCVEEMSGQPLLDPATVGEDIRPLKLSLVGAYAIRIDWSDGHNTGIYPYELLWKLCPCGTHPT
jgi:DUF971 family protein